MRTRRACATLVILLGLVFAHPTAAAPTYMEEGDGETTVWLDVGGAGLWATDRAPLAGFAPLVLGLGVAHRLGEARLGSRVHFFAAPGGDRRLAFVYADLMAVEQVLALGTWRPFWRLALGVGLDLQGTRRSLGSEGYFNADNGPSGGIGLTHAWGVEVYLSERWFTRVEADARVYGSAGRNGALLSGHLGFGRSF